MFHHQLWVVRRLVDANNADRPASSCAVSTKISPTAAFPASILFPTFATALQSTPEAHKDFHSASRVEQSRIDSSSAVVMQLARNISPSASALNMELLHLALVCPGNTRGGGGKLLAR